MNAPGVASKQQPDDTILFVRGMYCGSCAAAVESLLKRQPGVLDAAVNFAAGTALLRWDTTQTGVATLAQVVRRLGYRLQDAPPNANSQGVDLARKKLQWRLAAAVVFGMWCMMPALLVYLAPLGLVEPEATWPLALASGVFALPVLTYSGAHFYRAGWRTLRMGVPGLDTLITFAVVAATLLSAWRLSQGESHVYFDAAVMLITFQLIARLLDTNVRRRATDIIHRYLGQSNSSPVTLDDGSCRQIPADQATPGMHILPEAGQPLCLDGQIGAGEALIDFALITGESQPVPVRPGDRVYAGCVVIEGCPQIQVTAGVGQRRIDGITRAIHQLLCRKTSLQRLTDRIARVLLPTVVVAALASVVLAWFQGAAPGESLARGLAVLIISCPCALSLAIPLVIMMGYARLATRGILLQDPAAFELAADIEVVVFDKTGTLTTDRPAIAACHPQPGWTPQALLQLAINTLQGSSHPTARGLALEGAPSLPEDMGTRTAIPGQGTLWRLAEHRVLAGRSRWLEQQGVSLPELADTGMSLHLAFDGQYAGRIDFQERLNPEAARLVKQLKARGIAIYMLSGDTRNASLALAKRLNIPPARVISEASPEQKLRFVENLQNHYPTAFIGDGLNDGLALASARIGIAINTAPEAAQSAAAVQLTGGLDTVASTLDFARQARRLMRQNLVWAIAYNGLALPLAVAGWVQPVIAAVAMSLSSLCVLGNSLRIHHGDQTPINTPEPGQTRPESRIPQPELAQDHHRRAPSGKRRLNQIECYKAGEQ